MNINTVFDFVDYKKFFNDWVESQPNSGHGEYRRLALALDVSTTMISQVFKGDKHLSMELAADLCDYLGLGDDEADYLLLLVESQKAGSVKLQKRLLRQIKARQEKARNLENRVKASKMTEEVKTVFYSSWVYSATRLLADLPQMDSAASIADKLHLPRNQVQRVLEFLLNHGLVVVEKNKMKLGPTRTHTGNSSHFTSRHHQNWRLQGFNRMQTNDNDQFFYTGPMTLSKDVAEKIRQELPSFIEKIAAQVEPSPSEVARCLNIDWFEF
jgi:uncharacterized protein (TIGR02147 family)